MDEQKSSVSKEESSISSVPLEIKSRIEYDNPADTKLVARLIVIHLIMIIIATSIALYYESRIKDAKTVEFYLDPNSNLFFKYTLIILLIWEVIFLCSFQLASSYFSIIKNKMNLIVFWIFIITIIFVIIVQSLFQQKNSDYLIAKFRERMVEYTENIDAKNYIDLLQQSLECCGLKNFLDWTSLQESQDTEFFPPSCCLPNFETCNPWNSMKANDESECDKFYVKGCVEEMRKIKTERTSFILFIIIFLISFFIFTLFLFIKRRTYPEEEFDSRKIDAIENEL